MLHAFHGALFTLVLICVGTVGYRARQYGRRKGNGGAHVSALTK